MTDERAGTSRRAVGLLVVAVLVVVAATLGWMYWRARAARAELMAARADVTALREDLLAGEVATANERLAAVRQRTDRARELTSDVVWDTYGFLPGIGATPRTVRELAAAADRLADDVLAPLAEIAPDLDPKALRPAGNRIATQPLVRSAPVLRRALDDVTRIRRQLSDVSGGLVIGNVRRAHGELAGELDDFGDQLAVAADGAEVAPALLGGAGPRRYFLAVQTNAEARGSGGLLGAFGILEVADGRLALGQLGPNTDLRNVEVAPRSFAADYTSRYRRFQGDTFWLNANLSPHFPYTHAAFSGLYEKTTGTAIDGTIAIDPIGLSYLLKVTGPATLAGGEQVTGENIVDLTQRDAYRRIPDNEQRDEFFQQIARAAYDKVTSGAGDTKALLEALGRAAGERHLQVSVDDVAAQRVLEKYPIAGVVPTAPGPYLHVVTNNAAGTKLDYYLRRKVLYQLDRETGDATITVTLTNTAPARGLPPYVTVRPDNVGPNAVPAPVGQNRLYVSIFAGVGAELKKATLGNLTFTQEPSLPGAPLILGRTDTTMEIEKERQHSVFSTFVSIDPGKEVVLRLVVAEPDADRPLTVGTQAMVVPDQLTVRIRARTE